MAVLRDIRCQCGKPLEVELVSDDALVLGQFCARCGQRTQRLEERAARLRREQRKRGWAPV